MCHKLISVLYFYLEAYKVAAEIAEIIQVYSEKVVRIFLKKY